MRSKLEAEAELLLRAYKLPFISAENNRKECMFALSNNRRFIADFVVCGKIIFEIEGLVWSKKKGEQKAGGHQSPAGVVRDCDKSNTAMDLNYYYYRATNKKGNTDIHTVVKKIYQKALELELI